MSAPMPRLIYGTAWKKERTAALVAQALREGFRGIDTACQPRHYHEAGVGEALERVAAEGIARESLYLQTKFTPPDGQDPANTPYDRGANLSSQVAQSFKVSQRNLRTDYVDALVLHSPLFPFSETLTVWRAMEAIAKTGGALRLGISNCYDFRTFERLYSEAEIKPALLQNRFYADTGYDIKLRAFCDANAIRYQSFWSLTANPHVLAAEPVIRAAMKRGVETPQIFYAYLIAKGITPLDGTTSQAHMQADLKVFDIALTPEEITAIDSLIES